SHLMMCLWGWRLWRTRKHFKDINNPEKITNHFSKTEIVLAKLLYVNYISFALYIIAFGAVKWIWPGAIK
ncbi:MAG: hypothetical protein V1793_08410, partial [Pseudomonadota bacterium]